MNNHINSNDTQGIKWITQTFSIIRTTTNDRETKIQKHYSSTAPMLAIHCVYFNVENTGISMIVAILAFCCVLLFYLSFAASSNMYVVECECTLVSMLLCVRHSFCSERREMRAHVVYIKKGSHLTPSYYIKLSLYSFRFLYQIMCVFVVGRKVSPYFHFPSL